MRILIAEDDAVSRTILQKTIEKYGHQCLVAKDGCEAWDLFQEADVDVVISDWMMPGIDGIELCQRVRATPRPGYVYFVFLTARVDKEYLLMGMQAGADDYLTKPLDSAELQVRLMVAARITSLHQQLANQKQELEHLNRELFRQARKDHLTQLSNRLQFREDIAKIHDQLERYGYSYCLALCDIDYFKRYNDTYGHPAADQVLRTVATTIESSCRNGDAAYRYGGEEFLILLPNQSLETAALAVNRVRQAIEALAIPHTAKMPPGVVTISAGVAMCDADNPKTSDVVLCEADTALYRAKQDGRNQVAVYEVFATTGGYTA